MPNHGEPGRPGEPGVDDGGDGGDGGRGGDGGQGGVGIQGEKGNQGNPGEQGRQGFAGTPGLAGRIGLTGGQGETGHTGLTGDTGRTGERGKTGTVQTKLDRYALIFVVVITALSAIYFASISQHRLTDASHLIAQGELQQAQADAQRACQQQIISETIVALKARSTFAETQAQVLLTASKAQQTFLRAIAVKGVTHADSVRAYAAYQEALDFSITATSDQLLVNDRRPYPTQAAIERCTR